MDELVVLLNEDKELAEADELEADELDADEFEDHSALAQDLNAAAEENSVTAAVAAGNKRPAKKKKRAHGKNLYPMLATIYTTLTPGEVITAPSTETGFRAIWKLWDAFCTADLSLSGGKPYYVQVFGLQLYSEREILKNKVEQRLFDLAYTTNSFDLDRIVRFFSFLVDKQDPPSTNDTLTKAKGFLNSHLKWEYAARVKASDRKIQRKIGDIIIGDVTEIKNMVKTVRNRKAAEMLALCVDIQADIDNAISADDEIKMMVQILDPVLAGEVEKMNDHYRLVFGATWTSLRGTTRRGEECYNQKLIQRFCRMCPNIGPEGTLCGFIITLHCKHNTVGRTEYIAVAPHLNPLLCSNGWHGILWIEVYVDGNTPFPNFDKFEEVFNVPTYHGFRDPRKSIGDTTLIDIFNTNFNDAGIICDKVTHQPRRQTLQELDNKGVPLSSASRLSGHKTSSKDQGSKAQQESYLTNPPINAMVAAAGGDHTCPESHQPPRTTVIVPDELLQLIFPALIMTRKNVYARYFACTTHEERKEQRLCTLKGCIDGLILDVTRFLQMAASRFVDPKDPNILQKDSLTIQGHFKNAAARGGAAYRIFNHRVFDSDVYKTFAARVHCAEDEYHALLDLEEPPLGPGQQKQLSKMSRQIDRRFTMLSKQLITQISRVTALVPAQSFIASQSVPASPAPPMIPTQHTTSSPRHVVVPEPTSQYRKDGKTKRQRQPQLRQGELLNLEAAQGAAEPGIERKELEDSHCFTFEQHYSLYKTKWKPLEDKHGNAWRADIKVNGKLKNSRTTWWGYRYPMYIYVESAMNRKGWVEQVAIQEATTIFETVPQGRRSGRRCIKKLNKAFWAKLEEMGIENSKGTKRPNSTTQQARGPSQQANGPSEPSRARVSPPPRRQGQSWRNRRAEEEQREIDKSPYDNFLHAFAHVNGPPQEPISPLRNYASAQRPRGSDGCMYIMPQGPAPPIFGTGIGNPLQRHGDHAPAWGGNHILMHGHPPPMWYPNAF
jgi:hypothetical protein